MSKFNLKTNLMVCLMAIIAIMVTTSCKKDNDGPAPKIIKHVTEDITEQTVWYADTLYLISNKTIKITSKLTIRPGTVIKLEEGGLNFTDNGYPIAVGTEDEPIVFTSIYDDTYGGDTDGDEGVIAPKMMNWDNIIINTTPLDFQMKYCNFLYGTSVVLKSGGLGEINYCTFAHMGFPLAQFLSLVNPALMYELIFNGGAALTVQFAIQTFSVKNCTFYDNTIPMTASQFMNVDSTNHFSYNGTGNLMNGIYIFPPLDNNILDMFKFNIRLDEDEVPYVFMFDYTIKDGASLNFSKDATVKCYTDVQITVESGGALNLNNHNVIFTSYKDDEHGGDTNADGNSSTPMDGDWTGIYISDIISRWLGGANVLYDETHFTLP